MTSRLDGLVESMGAGVWVLDPQYRTEYVNPCMARMLGCAPEEMGGALFLDFVPEDTHTAARAHFEQSTQGGRGQVDLPLQPRQGSSQWFMVSTRLLPAASPERASLVCVVVDITERKLAEEALRKTEAHYRVLAETAEDHIFVINREDRVDYVNQAAARQLRTAPEQLIGRLRSELFPPDIAERQGHSLQRVFDTGKPLYMEARTLYLDREVWLSTWLAPIPDEAGGVLAVLGISRDITERRRLEVELSNAQKLEAIGRLAGGIAHDFNNHLTAILGYIEMMLKQTDGDTLVANDLQEVQRAAQRAAALVRRLLAFGRRQVLRPQSLNLNTLIEGLRPMLERLIGEFVHIDVALAPDLLPITGDAGELEQVVMNLVLNARDAMPAGGTLTIETSLLRAGEPRRPTMTSGAYALMTIRDTGAGMNSHVKAHVFEPFFTTKPEGQGTGLGLSTVYGIVKQLDGFIWVESEIGQGSTFQVYLPVALDEPVPEPVSPATTTQPPAGRRKTILLVEDEHTVRRFARLALERHGFVVIEAATPEEALSLAATSEQPLSLLLTDVVMPRINGRELADRLKQMRPDLPVLYMSGYPSGLVLQDGLIDPSMRLMSKPFTAAELIAGVHEALGRQ